MNKKNKIKKPWPTEDAMHQVYKNKLWGGNEQEYYSGAGSHLPELVNPYIETISNFLAAFKTPPTVCDLGCGDFNIGKRLAPLCEKYIAIDIVPDLIAHNKEKFKIENVEFLTFDIAKDPLPAANCAILRQVLQHLSNAEITEIVKKLYNFQYLVLTEHLPEGNFPPNKDIISGQGIRLKKQSGVVLTAPPFNFKPKEEKHLLSIKSPRFKGLIVTKVYKI